MDVSQLRNHGVSFSDSESRWPAALKRRMQRGPRPASDARRVSP